MPLNRAALIRLTTIDRCLQNRYRRWTLDDLIEACSAAIAEMEGRYEGVSRRTVQGDIQLMRSDRLGYNAPIVVVERKYYEYADPDFSITKIPLSSDDVTTLNSAVDILRHFRIFPQLAGASDVIGRLEDFIKVSVERRTPAIDLESNERLHGLEHIPKLYDAVRKHRPLIVRYQSFKALRPKDLHVSPYLLKEYRNRWFLLCCKERQLQRALILAVDRMLDVTTDKDVRFTPNPYFDVEHFFDNVIGVTKNLGQAAERVVLRLAPDEAPYVLTKPMHRSQAVIAHEPDGSLTIELRVVLNYELEREILGFGASVEVIEPRLLRHRISRAHQLASLIYTK